MSDRYRIEVDHPSGSTLRVDPIDQAQYLPNLNGKPELQVPVRKSDRWLDDSWEGAEPDMRAWLNGQRLPIDELRRVERQDDRAVLVGEGGKQLDAPVAIEVDQEEAYIAARDAVQSNTAYATDFDDPASGTDERLVQEASSETDLLNRLAEKETDPNGQLLDTTPAQFTNGGIESLQTCWTVEAEDWDDETGDGFGSTGDTALSGNEAIGFRDQVSVRYYDFTPQYDIPAGAFEIFTGTTAPPMRRSSSGSLPARTSRLARSGSARPTTCCRCRGTASMRPFSGPRRRGWKLGIRTQSGLGQKATGLVSGLST
ncbi:hypothetical protein ACFQL1_01600 [Halomicroarcula sp. GCM10025709]|uniref:hypothetical protein n=1 Tax=Halomicroarcula sp. GCM10025709 TaxID=3252669 RepID=UPI00360A08D4